MAKIYRIGKCGCCGKRCSGCVYAVAIIFTAARPSADPVEYTDPRHLPGVIIGGVVDDLPNTCATRVYFFAPAGTCATPIADLQTAFGVDCVKVTAISGVVDCTEGKNVVQLQNFDGTTAFPTGASIIVYKICDNGVSFDCQVMQAGPLYSCVGGNLTVGFTINSSCCCCPQCASRTVTDGVLNSTGTVTSATAHFTVCDVGDVVTGTGIPANTTILSVTNATTIVISHAATVTASGVTLTFTCPGCNYTVITGTGSVCLYDPALVLCDAIAMSGTGRISSDNFYSWSNLGGAAGTDLGNTISGVTTGGVGFTATIDGPGHFERRCATFPSYSGDFTPDEPLLFLNNPLSPPPPPGAYPGDLVIVFDQPVRGAGFRVQQNNATFRDDFFIDAGVTLTPPGSGTGLFVDASAPGANSAPFYGIAGSDFANCRFSALRVGFAGSPTFGPHTPFVVSTLEVLNCPVHVDHSVLLADDGNRLVFDNGKAINVAF